MASFESYFIRDPETGELTISLIIPEIAYEIMRKFCEQHCLTPVQAIGICIAILDTLPANPESLLTHMEPNRHN